ncbi:MAG: PsiF repeat-containing protein [Gallionellales bacterium GWA2_60_18]|nr:MAG: PsiF repeat-containing protein [Gallionellales bacterium GWA2_60_18]
MKKLIALACTGFVFAVSAPAFASPQQDKMKGCNEEARQMGVKGDERKAFMKKCLSKDYELKHAAAMMAPAAKPVAPATPATPAMPATTQQDRMKACNAEAKGKALMGDARKMFMSECLKK